MLGKQHIILKKRQDVLSVIVLAKYRGNGFGKQGLQLLCESAKQNGIRVLYDDILINNPSVNLFLKNGFEVVETTKDIIVVKKVL